MPSIWGLCCQKQVSQTRINNYITQFTVGCSYLSMPEITASGSKVLIYASLCLLGVWHQLILPITRTDPRPAVRSAEGPNSFHWKKCGVGSFMLRHKISRTACCFGIRTFLKQYGCYENVTIWYTDHQYFAQYSEIINNLQWIPLIFCNYAVRSCVTWRKRPGQSPRNVLSISDLELYVTGTSMGVCDPATD